MWYLYHGSEQPAKNDPEKHRSMIWPIENPSFWCQGQPSVLDPSAAPVKLASAGVGDS